MKVATRSSLRQQTVTKSVEVRLNKDAVNAYKNRQIGHHRHAALTKETSVTIVGANNRRTIHSMNVQTTASAQTRNSYGMTLHRNAACQVNMVETLNRMICNGNASASSSSSSLVKSAFQRNINDCFKALTTLNEQHAHARINLKTDYNAKLEQLKRDYERRSDEIKKKCLSDAGF